MPTPEQSLQNLNQFLDNSIDSFSKDIPGIQDEVFRKVQGLLKDLDLSRGDVKATAKNLRKINRIKREIEQIILSEKYIDEVTKFNQAFEKGTDLQTSYFNSIQKGFSTPDFISTLRDASMANTKAALTESGIQSNIVDKAGDIIQRNISESANFSDLVEDMRTFLTKTEQGVGALSRHTSQIVTDSLNTYAAEYNRFVSDNLDMKWFVYSGAIVEGSRSFCRSLIKKKYVHKSEFGKVSRGSFVPKPIDLKGLKPNTNAKTLQINRGGWHCNHLLSPIAEEFVPNSVRAKFAKATTEKPIAETGGIKSVKDAKNHEELSSFIKNKHNLKRVDLSRLDLDIAKQQMVEFDKLASEYNIPDLVEINTDTLNRGLRRDKRAQVTRVASDRHSILYFDEFSYSKSKRGTPRWTHKTDDFDIAHSKNHNVITNSPEIQTTTHEFAHVFGAASQDFQKGFFDKARVIKTEYTKELNRLKNAWEDDIISQKEFLTAKRKIHISDYAATNLDEFVAESFAAYKRSSNPSAYAIRIGKLIDENFLK